MPPFRAIWSGSIISCTLPSKLGCSVCRDGRRQLRPRARLSHQSDAVPLQALPIDERHPSYQEDSYSYSKLAGELLLASYTRAYGIRTYVTRPAAIYTPARRQQLAHRPCRPRLGSLAVGVGGRGMSPAPTGS